MKKIFDYFKYSVFSSLSILGVMLVFIAAYFYCDTAVDIHKDAIRKKSMISVSGTITNASDPIIRKRQKKHGYSTSYKQNFDVSYEYNGITYIKKYQKAPINSVNAFQVGEEVIVWLNPNDAKDSEIDRYLVTTTDGMKPLLWVVGFPGLVIIFMPKPRDKTKKNPLDEQK